ncbi:MAG: M56 family metallopeptidase [Planctomycetes bacterium]|nr:M56 family metallopeptidase [Planctomycetota bacterium]
MPLLSIDALGPFLWRSTLLLAVALLLRASLLRRCPAHCHATLLASLLLLPFLWLTATLRVPISSLPRPRAPASSVAAPHRGLAVGIAALSESWNAPGKWLGERVEPKADRDPAPFLLAAWIAGVFLFALRDLRRRRRLARVLAEARPAERVDLLARFRELSRTLGVRRGIRLLSASDVPGPFAAGILRPLILVPANIEAGAEVEATLAHEILHHCRHDLLLHFLGRVTRTVFWFQPLTHLVLRQAAFERERAVDLAVVRALGRPEDYASVLVAAARRGLLAGHRLIRSVAPLGEGASMLKRRIEMLLSHARFKTSRHPFLFAAGAGVLLAGAASLLLLERAAAAEPADEISTSAVETGEPGRFRLSFGLTSVSRVELDGKEIPSADWTYHPDAEILEVRVPIENARALEAHGERAVPWVFNVSQLCSNRVRITLGDEALVLGKDFTVDVKTRTVRLLRFDEAWTGRRFTLSYEDRPGIFTSFMGFAGEGPKRPRLPPELANLTRAALVASDRPGFFRLGVGLSTVEAVTIADMPKPGTAATEPRRLDLKTHFAYHAEDGLLEMRVPVDAAQEIVTAYGQRAVPWTWTIAGLVPESVQVVIGEKVAERGVDYDVDAAIGTISFKRSEDCGPDALYFLRYQVASAHGVTVFSHGSNPRGPEILGNPGPPLRRPVLGPGGQHLESTPLWSTGDPRVFVPQSPVQGNAWKLTVKPRQGEGETIEWTRGEDFLFDNETQRVVLVEGRTLDHDRDLVQLWVDGVALQTYQFPAPIDRKALKVSVNGVRLVEGEGFVILEDGRSVRVEAKALGSGTPGEWSIEVEMGQWKATSQVSVGFFSRVSGD